MVERLEVHLLYASVVWLAAWLLTSMPRGSATTKYWIWVATSLNFLLPLGALPGRVWPSRVAWFTANVPLRIPPLGALWTVWASLRWNRALPSTIRASILIWLKDSVKLLGWSLRAQARARLR